jgi:hypothetical protein
MLLIGLGLGRNLIKAAPLTAVNSFKLIQPCF